MEIKSDLYNITKVIFKNRGSWRSVTEDQKNEFFFIINRYLAKKYPEYSLKMNSKGQDKVIGLDIIYNLFGELPYPDWFWASKGGNKDINGDKLTKSEREFLIKKWELGGDFDLDWIIKKNPELVKDEIKNLKNKNKKKND
jgi:hypothetical protein